MNASTKKQSSAAPVFLGLLGLLAIAGGVFLFLQNKTAQDAKLKKAIALIKADASAPSAPAPQAEPAPAPVEPQEDGAKLAAPADAAAPSDALTDTAAQEEAGEPEEAGKPETAQPPTEETPAPDLGPGKWRFKVSTRPLDIGDSGEAAVDAAAKVLLEDDNDKLRITGFNSPKTSSSMAKNIARKIRTMIAEEGVKTGRIYTEAKQDDEIEKFEVLIELIERD